MTSLSQTEFSSGPLKLQRAELHVMRSLTSMLNGFRQ